MKALCLVLVALVVSVSSALMQAYSVEPVKASWSGWTGFQDTVAQTVTCNWDELDSAAGCYVELFVGSRGASPGGYVLNVYEVDGGVDPVATSPETTAVRDHAWLRFPLGVATGYEFTKGKTYEFRLSQRTGTLRCATLTRSGFDTACGGRTMA